MRYFWVISLFVLLAAVSLESCSSRRRGDDGDFRKSVRAAVEGDTVALKPPPKSEEVLAEPKTSDERKFDLLHTSLELVPRWESRTLDGIARLSLKPYFYPTDSLHLDAKGFIIKEVALENEGENRSGNESANRQPLRYRYDSLQLHIALGRTYEATDSFTIYIAYTARPDELKTHLGQAIAEEKGLYFINADGKDPYKPRQFWTQGEPKATSCWAPTLDQPNERCTEEIKLRVADTLTTLSNGVLVDSQKHSDGTRTDHWRMDLPHAPYLFMMAAGNFVVVQDRWRDREVSYYVEPEYEPYARLIFGNTPEMLEFFSEKFGVDYPWPKYAQIVVRDFVSGAMENTTATVHMDALQHDSRAHLDNTHEDYISHELTHQWFGDYVTCESWSHLTLNEAFATYGEYLWKEYKYGRNAAEEHLAADRDLYFDEAQTDAKNLIRFQYGHPDEMFDRHSYQKGGAILHMLRRQLGDEAFFASLKYYLQRYAFSPVEADELRMAFEDVTGKDLKVFFDEWFFGKGHPVLSLRYQWIENEKLLRVRVEQIQGQWDWKPFHIETSLRAYFPNGTTFEKPIKLHSVDSTFDFRLLQAPVNALVDPERSLVANWIEDKPESWWQRQAENGDSYLQMRDALRYVLSQEATSSVGYSVDSLRLKLSQHVDAPVRELALEGLEESAEPAAFFLNRCWAMATEDPKAPLRLKALYILSDAPSTLEKDSLRWHALLERATNDSSYNVSTFALARLYELDNAAGLAAAKRMQNTRDDGTRSTVANIFLQEKTDNARVYFEQALRRSTDFYERLYLVHTYGEVLPSEPSAEELSPILEAARRDESWIVRLTAARLLTAYISRPEVKELFLELRQTEKNERLKEIYEGMELD